LRCARCGNENLTGNRFCGMCGATLLQPTAPGASTTSPAPPRPQAVPSTAHPAPAQGPSTSRTSTPVSDSPSISGPSFLGLNDSASRERAHPSSDPYARPHSRSLDYLLEDDQDSHRGGAGKYFLILLALALAVGFGYLRWKGQGFGWLGSHSNKPSAAEQQQNPDATSTDTNSSPPAPASNSPTPPAAAQSQPSIQPATDTPSTTSTPVKETPPANAAAPETPPAKTPVPTDAGAKDAANSSEDTAKKPAEDNAGDTEADAEEQPAPKPKPPVREAPSKPTAAKPVPAVDAVAEARKYLYGRGAAQDCDRGLRLLKPAANQSNAKAMIEMGALYSAGLCTPHDLPTAYRWFALALRKDPENQAVQADLQKLWGEMTQPERQLAIRLSQ